MPRSWRALAAAMPDEPAPITQAVGSLVMRSGPPSPREDDAGVTLAEASSVPAAERPARRGPRERAAAREADEVEDRERAGEREQEAGEDPERGADEPGDQRAEAADADRPADPHGVR